MPTEWLQRLTTGLSETLVYVAIGLVTFIGLCKCIYPVFRNGSLLNRAVIQLEKSTAQGKPMLWRDARFLGRALREDWQRFLLNAGQLDLRGIPCHTEDYINEDTVVYKPGHAQLAELIPSLLTSLGILGTFMGMMEGLTGLNFSDATETIGSIPHLLGGMRFAFATSVAGIVCSLAFNMLNRIVVGRAFKALDTFEDAFYDLAMARPLSPEVQLLCQRQDEEGRAQEVAGHIAVAIERAMEPVAIAMERFLQGTAGEQVSGIQHIVDQFLQQMNVSLAGQISELADMMHRLTQAQGQAQHNLQHTLQTAEMLAVDARRVQEASREIAERIYAMGGSQEAMESSAYGQLHTQTETLTAAIINMTAAVDELSARLDQRG